MALLLAEVFVLRASPKPLIYGLPEELRPRVRAGSLVQVPLRRQKLPGLVWRLFSPEKKPPFAVRPIAELWDECWALPPTLLQLLEWVSKYYGASLSSCIDLALPKSIFRTTKRGRAKAAPGESTENDGQVQEAKEALGENIGGDAQTQAGPVPIPTLSPEQAAAVEDVLNSYRQRRFVAHLLYGVTGSGKTDVYLQVMEKVLADGDEVLYLVPELSLTPQTLRRLRERFAGHHEVAVWHSGLGEREKRGAWEAIASGKAKIVVGARSALFLPQRQLRLIIVDEEHDSSYKQNENPRYHGRDVAIYRAFLHGALCILGSATPSLETFFNTRQRGFRLNSLPRRVDRRSLPIIHVADMRHERNGRLPALFSRQLLDRLRERLERKEQSILFLNRRGYASTYLCTGCDYVATCPSCSVSLTYHRVPECLSCHLCGYREALASRCPRCASPELRLLGSGTQKAEAVLQKIFPQANCIRIDSDTASQRKALPVLLEKFRRGEAEILIGTQMISKGLDFPNVTLVGLLQGDLSLHVPDFRSGERTFQLISQVAGRAGRGERPGEVVLQTFLPQSELLRWAQHAQFEEFAEEELRLRQQLGYPPYRHIIRHLLRGKNAEATAHQASAWGDFLRQRLNPSSIELRGPASSSIGKIHNYHRHTLFFFVAHVSQTLPLLLQLRENFPWPRFIPDFWDVDPLDMSYWGNRSRSGVFFGRDGPFAKQRRPCARSAVRAQGRGRRPRGAAARRRPAIAPKPQATQIILRRQPKPQIRISLLLNSGQAKSSSRISRKLNSDHSSTTAKTTDSNQLAPQQWPSQVAISTQLIPRRWPGSDWCRCG
jgi:primosomal protein N' (replication factor Y)